MSGSEVLSQAASSPTVAVAVPLGTAAISLADIQNLLATVSMFVGLIVSIVLLGNHLIKRRILIQQEKLLERNGKLEGEVET